MAQADYVVANGTGAAVRSDLNGQLAAIVSNNSGATEPGTMYAYQWWADTTAGLLKLRNSANNAWITLRELDGTLLMENGTAAAPGLSFASDPDSGIFLAGANEFGIATNGVERVEFGASEVVFNDGGANYDFRIEGDTNANLFFVDASTDRVGIGNSGPASKLHINYISTIANPLAEANAGLNINGSSSVSMLFGSDLNSPYGAYIQASNNPAGSGFPLLLNPSGGNVGIGNTGPGATLDIKAAASTHPLIVQGPSSEFARIDSSGNLLVGTTSALQSSKLSVLGTGNIADFRTSSSGGFPVVCENTAAGNTSMVVFLSGPSTTTVGSITYNSSTGLIVYATTSDYRLKTVVGAVTGHGERIDALEPVEYTWNSNGLRTRGFLAHKFQEIYEGSVTGTKDEIDVNGKPVYQGMQASSAEVMADLVAEIKSLRARVTALEST